MKNEHSGLKSLLSVLSILVAFALVCGGVIYVLIRTGAMNVGESGETEAIEPTSPSHTKDSSVTELHGIEFGKDELYTVLSDIPFYDRFYARIYMTYIGRYGVGGEGAIFKMENYDVYKNGDKYKIVTYNSNMSPQKYVICDGESVSVVNEKNEQKIYPVSDAFTFVNQSPMPDFSIFQTERYEITEYSLSDGEYTISCYFPDMGITDELRITEDGGVVTYFRSVFGGKTFVEFSLFDFNSDYPFAADEFSVKAE